MKQLKFLPLSIQILIYFLHACVIVMFAILWEMLWVAKVLPAPNILTNDQIDRIRVISTYSYLYKFHLILTIYVFNSVNALIDLGGKKEVNHSEITEKFFDKYDLDFQITKTNSKFWFRMAEEIFKKNFDMSSKEFAAAQM